MKQMVFWKWMPLATFLLWALTGTTIFAAQSASKSVTLDQKRNSFSRKGPPDKTEGPKKKASCSPNHGTVSCQKKSDFPVKAEGETFRGAPDEKGQGRVAIRRGLVGQTPTKPREAKQPPNQRRETWVPSLPTLDLPKKRGASHKGGGSTPSTAKKTGKTLDLQSRRFILGSGDAPAL